MQGNTLFSAMKDENWQAFQTLLHEGETLEQTDAQGKGLICHLVSVLPRAELLEDFLSTQAPAKRASLLKQKDNKGQTLLHHAAEAGNLVLMQWLVLQNPDDVNVQDQYGYTPLHKASTSESIDCLLKHGAIVHLSTVNGDNPIQYAMGLGLIEEALKMTRCLLEQVELPSLSQVSLLGLYQAFYRSFSREQTEEKQDVKILRQQLQRLQGQLFLQLQSIPLKDPSLPLLLFLGSEVALAQNQYTLAMYYAAAGVLHSKDLIHSLLKAQRQRILIQFRKTTDQYSDVLPVFTLSQSFCHMSAHTPITLSDLIESIRIHRSQLKLLLSTNAPIQSLLEMNSTFFQNLTTILFKMALSHVDSNQKLPPYALLTLGSMSQNEMSPYSDLEFALLIPDACHRQRFESIIDCMELLVIALGETPMEKLSLNPAGYRFDITPKNDKLLITPQEMAAHHATMDEQSVILRQVLRGANFLQGDVTLFQQYKTLLQNTLKSRTQLEALTLFKNALMEFSPAQFGSKKEQRKTSKFEVKGEFYRLPSQTLLGLCLYHGLPPVLGSFARIKQLYDKGYLSRVSAYALTELLEGALRLRFQAHLHYETEKEDLYHPDRTDLYPIGNVYGLDAEFVQNQLPAFYNILFGLEFGLQDFLAGQTNFFRKKSLQSIQGPLSPFFQARMHERLLVPDKAMGFYQAALQVAPKDWSLQAAYHGFIGHLLDTLYKERETLVQQGDAPQTHDEAAALAFLPLLAKKIELLDKRIEEHRAQNQAAIQKTVQVLLEHENHIKFYLKVYRRILPSFRLLFHEAILTITQKQKKYDSRFIEKLLKALNQEPDETGQRQYWLKQKLRWEASLQALVSNKPATAQTFNLASPLLAGSFVLLPEVKAKLLDADGEFKQSLFQGVQHQVVRLNVILADGPRNLYLKAYPEMPGMTYLIEQMHQHIIGHGTSLSELIKLERPGKEAIPILISEEILGPTLHEVLTDAPETIESLNRRAFTELVWMAILTNPEDGLPTNYIVHAPPGEALTLVSIDHDHALFPAFALEAEQKSESYDEESLADGLQVQLQVKTILFCLDLMKNGLDKDAREAFLRLNPQKVLSTVLRQTQEQNIYYTELFTQNEIQKFHQSQNKRVFRSFQVARATCTIPIPLKAGDAIQIYQKFVKLQRFIRRFPEASLLQCLTYCEPRVGLVYSKAFETYDNPLERLLNLGRYPMNRHGQMVTRTRARETLKLVSQDLSQEAYTTLGDLTPEQGLAELDLMSQEATKLDAIRAEVQGGQFERFNQLKAPFHKAWIISGSPEMLEARLDWKKLSPSQQSQLLKLMKGIPFEQLYLGNCTALTLSDLQNLVKYSPELQELDLSGHPNLTDFWLLKLVPELRSLRTLILCKLPNLIHIRNIKSSLPYLEYLVLSDNPELQSLSLAMPQLKFLQARNNPQLPYVETGSHKLLEADLRNNPALTRKGIEGLAHAEGLGQINRLQLQSSGVEDFTMLEDYPMLLIHPAQSKEYQEMQNLLTQYLGDNWQSHLPSQESRRRLGLMMKLGLRRSQILPMLLKLVGDGDSAVRPVAAWVLGEYFKTAIFDERAQILPILLKLVSDEDSDVSHAAAQTLRECLKTTPEEQAQILPRLLKLAGNENWDVRRAAALALEEYFKTAIFDERAQISPMLLKLAGDEVKYVRLAAARALGEFFKTATLEERVQILPRLLKLASEKSSHVRSATAAALGECFKTATSDERAQILPRLLKLASDKKLAVRPAAARALGEYCKTATPRERAQILRMLLKLADDKDWYVRRDAAQPLGECCKTATPHERAQILLRLWMLAADRNLDVSSAAALALGKCFKTATPGERAQILPMLLTFAGEQNSAVCPAATEALGECFKTATPDERAQILTRFLKLAGDKNLIVRDSITNLLSSLGRTGFPLTIFRMLFRSFASWSQQKSPEVRGTLTKGLIGWTEGKETISILAELTKLLRTLAQDEDNLVRVFAEIALAKLQIRFNLEDTLKQIALEREAEETSQQAFVPLSLQGRRKVLPAIVVDLSLPEPLQQLIQAYEEKTQALEQRREVATERPSSSREVQAPTSEPAGNDVPIFLAEAKNSEQRGWNCFDVAIGLSRERLIEFAIANKHDLVFRKLLAPEIKTAAQITAVLGNMQDNKAKDLQTQDKDLQDLSDLLHVAEQFGKKEEAEEVLLHIQEKLDQSEEHFSPLNALTRLALPSNMQDIKQIQGLMNAYNEAHETIKGNLATCNEALNYPEGKRLSFSQLRDFFALETNCNQNKAAFILFNEALNQFIGHEKAVDAFCESEQNYKDYIHGYYGNKQWVIFIPSSGGQQNTSIVDIAARALNKKIIIHQMKGTTFEEIYRTEYEGNGIVHLQYNGYDHFTALKYNPAYVEGVNRELVTKFGLFKPPTPTEQPQAHMQHEEVQIADIVLKYLA